MRTREFLIVVLAAVLLSTGIGVAQEAGASVTGKITDPSGAAVVNATVTLRDVDRGDVFRTQSNEEGVYNLPRVPIGQYELRVEASGFQTAVRPAFALQLNQAAKVDIALAIGQVSQQMEVTDAAPLLQTETTQVGTVMESNAIASLPLETRNYNQLTLLVPGAGHHQPGVLQYRAGDLSTPAGPISTATASRPTTICWTAWKTPNSWTTTWPTRRTWTPFRR